MTEIPYEQSKAEANEAMLIFYNASRSKLSVNSSKSSKKN